jgi:hypothetical protein
LLVLNQLIFDPSQVLVPNQPISDFWPWSGAGTQLPILDSGRVLLPAHFSPHQWYSLGHWPIFSKI